MRISVVVLHYETISDTRECIDSLLNQSYEDFDIVVVDNGSVNGKSDAFCDDYSKNDKVHFIRSEENLGFANGNNLGIRYSLDNLNPELVVLANNDLVFSERDFLIKLVTLYQDSQFDFAGPRIVSTIDGMNQNPVRRAFVSRKDVDKRIVKSLILLGLSYLNMDLSLKKILAKPVTEYEYNGTDDFQLHGACMILSVGFFKKAGLLYNGTFMYAEEDILRYYVEKYGLKMMYLDKLEVRHKEMSSTNAVFSKGVKKRRFTYKHSIRSLSKLRRMMK